MYIEIKKFNNSTINKILCTMECCSLLGQDSDDLCIGFKKMISLLHNSEQLRKLRKFFIVKLLLE